MNRAILLIIISFLSIISQEFIPLESLNDDDNIWAQYEQNTVEFRNNFS